jgi:hypothetical protein
MSTVNHFQVPEKFVEDLRKYSTAFRKYLVKLPETLQAEGADAPVNNV